MKVKIEPSKALQMLDHGPTVLIGVQDESNSRLNLFAVSWIIPCSHTPPLVVFSCNPNNYSHELIGKTREFSVNIPSAQLIDKLHFCGTTSGRHIDKIEKLALTFVESQALKIPLIEECMAHLECRVAQDVIAGDHTLYIAEILAASAYNEFFEGTWRFKDMDSRTLHYLGGKRYAVIGEMLEAKILK